MYFYVCILCVLIIFTVNIVMNLNDRAFPYYNFQSTSKDVSFYTTKIDGFSHVDLSRDIPIYNDDGLKDEDVLELKEIQNNLKQAEDTWNKELNQLKQSSTYKTMDEKLNNLDKKLENVIKNKGGHGKGRIIEQQKELYAIQNIEPKRNMTPFSFIYPGFFNPAIRGYEEEESTTIIYNLFMGSVKDLTLQMDLAMNQKNAIIKDIWINVFNSPMEAEYKQAFEAFKQKYRNHKTSIHYTSSTYNYKFHGRFILSSMSTSKYILIIDDDILFRKDHVSNLIEHMNNETAIYGLAGHIRNQDEKLRRFLRYNDIEDPKKATPYHKKGDKVPADFLCGMWFFKRAWIDAFYREPVATYYTAEDIHLSYTIGKYLGLPTYIVNGHIDRTKIDKTLSSKVYSATKSEATGIRSEINNYYIGRGSIMAHQNRDVDTLVYVHGLSDALQLRRQLQRCTKNNDANSDERGLRSTKNPYCQMGRIMLAFSGQNASMNEVFESVGYDICKMTNSGFNMDVDYGDYTNKKCSFNLRSPFANMEEAELPMSTNAADLITSLSGVLMNMRPSFFMFRSKNPIIEQSVKVAIQSYLSSKRNNLHFN